MSTDQPGDEPTRWVHLDGTECVAGHDPETMLCADGWGEVISESAYHARSANPEPAATPADELREAVRLLRHPYNCLQDKDAIADLLEAIADDMDEHGCIEGSASKKVHPVSRTLGIVLEPRADWTAALALARMQPRSTS